MHKILPYLLPSVCLLHCNAGSIIFGQEIQDNIESATTYLDYRTSSLEKSLDITGKLQQKLLKDFRKRRQNAAQTCQAGFFITQAKVGQLIQKHIIGLRQLAGNSGISGLQNIQKDVYYAREKIYKEAGWSK